MELELLLEGEDGSKVHLPGAAFSTAVFGRDSPGFNSNDRTVSRRHVQFQLDQPGDRTVPCRVWLQVIGKNPVWVGSGGEVRVFRKLDKGEVMDGDWVCVSGHHPILFRLKVLGQPGDGDVSCVDVDPVKEFGFLVIGHEFDAYGKGRIREPKDWDWFLEESDHVSEEDEGNGENPWGRGWGRKGEKLGKRKKGGGRGGDYDDEDWTGESDEDKEIVAKSRKFGKAKMYATRSKNYKDKGGKERKGKVKGKDIVSCDDKDEDDETLGGFIVGEDELEDDEGVDDEEEEEEFFDDDNEEEEE